VDLVFPNASPDFLKPLIWHLDYLLNPLTLYSGATGLGGKFTYQERFYGGVVVALPFIPSWEEHFKFGYTMLAPIILMYGVSLKMFWKVEE
jgi:hypothetical protein